MNKQKAVITTLRNEVLDYLNSGFDHHLPTRGIKFFGNYSCNLTKDRTFYVVIPTHLDKSNMIYKIIDKVLQKELNKTLLDCKIIQDSFEYKNHILEFSL